MSDTEKQFEIDIESFLISNDGGWSKATDAGYKIHVSKGLDLDTLVSFIKSTQEKEWIRFEKQCSTNPSEKFYRELDKVIQKDGLLSVLRHGFQYRGRYFKLCYFKPESTLNDVAVEHCKKNICHCIRQWHYSSFNNNSVDMMLAINGIPIVAIELKNQLKHQSIDNAKKQWMYDRDPAEVPFRFNNRILVYFAVDLYNAVMTTRLNKEKTFFLPFDQGSNGAGNDGGAGNPQSDDGSYVTSYLWKNVLQKDSLLDIIQKFMNLEVKEENIKQSNGKSITKISKKLIFPRYHQLDVVRKTIADVKAHGAGRDYLIQHSAGSGKSNSIAWLTYRLASLHNLDNSPIFTSIIVLTDRLVLNQQLINTITGFEHQNGLVETISKGATSKDLKKAILNGKKIIVCNIQKFPVIYEEIGDNKGKYFAVIVDEAHSSQSGTSAEAVTIGLGNPEEALKEQAEIEQIAEVKNIEELDPILRELAMQGKHSNLSFFAFTATPKSQTLERFGIEHEDGKFHPFHEYSMKQAIEEGFILDVLANYTTYKNCWKIVKNTPDNPEVKESKAVSAIRRYKELHEYVLAQKAEIIVETFRDRTQKAIDGKGKMMVVTSSRLAAIRYHSAINNYIKSQNYTDIAVYVAFSGTVSDGGVSFTESGMNYDSKKNSVSESQLPSVFHNEGDILIVAEKYQTGFDEPYLHTMIVDKRLNGIKAVQTLSRLNRICPGKNSTFILDFVNKAEDIYKAFQPYYHETILREEYDVNNLYDTRSKCKEYGVYTDNIVNSVSEIKFDKNRKKNSMQGKITNLLKPCIDVFEGLTEDDKDSFRAYIRSFLKQYRYIAQITRLYDVELHKEYTLCEYLEPLLPKKEEEDFKLKDKVKLLYWKLEETYNGAIVLDDGNNIIEPLQSSPDKSTNQDEKTTLDLIIENINKRYSGEFTEADRVITEILTNELMKNEILKKQAQQDSYPVFETQFENAFSETAQDAYTQQTDAFESLFKDREKFNNVMQAVGQVLYQQFRAQTV